MGYRDKLMDSPEPSNWLSQSCESQFGGAFSILKWSKNCLACSHFSGNISQKMLEPQNYFVYFGPSREILGCDDQNVHGPVPLVINS